MTEHDHEAIPGLPGPLPEGERLLWRGAPDRALLARTAFHTRKVALYFALLTGLALVGALPRLHEGLSVLHGAAATAGVGLGGVALLHLLAWATARGAIYTVTDRRVVLRIGVAVPKCINLPLKLVTAIDLRGQGGAAGDVALRLVGPSRLGYAAIWPHARPLRLGRPEPMLRALPDAAMVADLVARACRAIAPDAGAEAVPAEQPTRQPARAAAAPRRPVEVAA